MGEGFDVSKLLNLDVIILAVSLLVTVYIARKLFFPAKPTSSESNVTTSESVDKNKPKMVVVWGSQSGTAQGFADEMVQQAIAYGFAAESVDAEEFDHENIDQEPLCVFLQATYGEGEPTDNAQMFYDWIMGEDANNLDLLQTKMAVFALGNRQYGEHFCIPGRRLHKRLSELNANMLVPLGEGDDDGDIEADFSRWQEDFWASIRHEYGITEAKKQKFAPSFLVQWKENVHYPGGLKSFRVEKNITEIATISLNKELRQDTSDGSKTRHIEIDIAGLNLSYTTADNLGVYPRNDRKIAGTLCKRLGVQRDAVFILQPIDPLTKKKKPLPGLCSVEDALYWYLDICSLAKPKFCEALAEYVHADNNDPDAQAEANKQKEQLLSWGGPHKDELHKHKLAVWEIIMQFPLANIPFADFLELCPRLQPRMYTIASSNKISPNRISLTVALTRVHLPNNRLHEGVASKYLCALEPGEEVCVFVRRSSFHLPKSRIPNPVIMVGPGTGVAPFRGFLDEGRWIMEKYAGKPRGPWSLYFGCRRRDTDFLYQEEMEAARRDQVLARLEVAFSRENDQKTYVQHMLAKHGSEVWKQMQEEKGTFFVCGATQMGRDVRELMLQLAEKEGGMSHELAEKEGGMSHELAEKEGGMSHELAEKEGGMSHELAEKEGGMSHEAAQEWLTSLSKSGRYVQELWSDPQSKLASESAESSFPRSGILFIENLDDFCDWNVTTKIHVLASSV
eukprot:g14765.t1